MTLLKVVSIKMLDLPSFNRALKVAPYSFNSMYT